MPDGYSMFNMVVWWCCVYGCTSVKLDDVFYGNGFKDEKNAKKKGERVCRSREENSNQRAWLHVYLKKISSTTTQRVPFVHAQRLKNELRVTVLPWHVCTWLRRPYLELEHFLSRWFMFPMTRYLWMPLTKSDHTYFTEGSKQKCNAEVRTTEEKNSDPWANFRPGISVLSKKKDN